VFVKTGVMGTSSADGIMVAVRRWTRSGSGPVAWSRRTHRAIVVAGTLAAAARCADAAHQREAGHPDQRLAPGTPGLFTL
jgi:hypothetical protein